MISLPLEALKLVEEGLKRAVTPIMQRDKVWPTFGMCRIMRPCDGRVLSFVFALVDDGEFLYYETLLPVDFEDGKSAFLRIHVTRGS